MYSMLVTDDVSHAETSLAKLDVASNMKSMLVTNDVYHTSKSPEKLDVA